MTLANHFDKLLKMLAITRVREAMKGLGLSQAALAARCEVSPEAVSNWLKGESAPRPAALLRLAEALDLSIDSLMEEGLVAPEPVVAFRTRTNRAPKQSALAQAVAQGEHLRELLPDIDPEFRIFSPVELTEPKRSDDYVRAAALRLRHGLGLPDTGPISVDQLLLLHRQAGSFLVPVLWGGDKVGHENALSVYLPDSRTSWVLFNLNCKIDDFKYWLAHELGHCYSLHALRDKDGELFAEDFARALLCPDPLEEQCWKDLNAAGNQQDVAYSIAEQLQVSVITIIRGADRYARRLRLQATGLDIPGFFVAWKAGRGAVPTVAQEMFGTDVPQIAEYVTQSESRFGTPIFQALGRWIAKNGKSASFVGSALNIGVGDARALADYLAN